MIAALSLLGSVASQVVGDVAGNAVGALTSGTTADPSKSFGSMLEQVSNDAMSKLKTGEATAISGMEGKASVQQVVKSVMDAQQALQTVVAVRDKVVSAYQEVSRMAI
ncbi:MAG TPA: flagellar hook-basal body complex protein FliE [Methylovirgula sp.]